MLVNIEDVLFWMDAIRNSDDRYRTLESFWKGQVRSKIWLIEQLTNYVKSESNEIVIHGGWNGVLSSLLFNSDIKIKKITSLDIDPGCAAIATTVNKNQEMQGRFHVITDDMCKHKYQADIVINTSCEHVTDQQLQTWFNNIPRDTIVVMQSNNYFELDEHVNCVNSSSELAGKVNFSSYAAFELELPKYTRYMVIGKKNDNI